MTTEREYINIKNRVCITHAKDILLDIVPVNCDAVKEEKLKEFIRVLAVWEIELFDLITDGE